MSLITYKTAHGVCDVFKYPRISYYKSYMVSKGFTHNRLDGSRDSIFRNTVPRTWRVVMRMYQKKKHLFFLLYFNGSTKFAEILKSRYSLRYCHRSTFVTPEQWKRIISVRHNFKQLIDITIQLSQYLLILLFIKTSYYFIFKCKKNKIIILCCICVRDPII